MDETLIETLKREFASPADLFRPSSPTAKQLVDMEGIERKPLLMSHAARRSASRRQRQQEEYNMTVLDPSKMTQADKAALQLGRMVMSTVFNQPDVNSADNISRFFVDSWLARNGSSAGKADALSIELMCGLQKTVNGYRYDLQSDRDDHPTTDDTRSEGASREGVEGDNGELFRYPTAEAQKIVSAIAFEALDRMIVEFGESTPVLKDIRGALFPAIFKKAIRAVSKPPLGGAGVGGEEANANEPGHSHASGLGPAPVPAPGPLLSAAGRQLSAVSQSSVLTCDDDPEGGPQPLALAGRQPEQADYALRGGLLVGLVGPQGDTPGGALGELQGGTPPGTAHDQSPAPEPTAPAGPTPLTGHAYIHLLTWREASGGGGADPEELGLLKRALREGAERREELTRLLGDALTEAEARQGQVDELQHELTHRDRTYQQRVAAALSQQHTRLVAAHQAALANARDCSAAIETAPTPLVGTDDVFTSLPGEDEIGLPEGEYKYPGSFDDEDSDAEQEEVRRQAAAAEQARKEARTLSERMAGQARELEEVRTALARGEAEVRD
jgi:hypothetical protein